ncbi:ester cyclase [Winogradskyella sp. 3972H.M.0a.05]|uniref:nuclear transport factor 2 family protein n=1 Tax=Winogradskyella sp. 3972H.M.0a.05 TaxID=2950277 RepID=UPI00339B4357
MKKLILISALLIVFVSCKEHEQRYFAESAETETIKKAVKAYESGDWDTWKSHFADTAKIYVNSLDGVSVDDRLKVLQGMTGAMSSYGFDREKEYMEMVLDKEKETWVYYWATHKGTFAATNKELKIPVHIAFQFVDGKVVEEHIYFDATAMNAEFAAIEAAAKAASEEASEEEATK